MDDLILSPIKLSDLERIIQSSVHKGFENAQQGNLENNKVESDLIDIKQASKFLGLAVPTLYAKVSERLIPHCKQGKRLFFSKEQLTTWVMSGQRRTVQDIQSTIK